MSRLAAAKAEEKMKFDVEMMKWAIAEEKERSQLLQSNMSSLRSSLGVVKEA